MTQGVQLTAETARRMIHRTRLAEAVPIDLTGTPSDNRLSRAYREFELTEELSGGVGSTAAVKWLKWNNTSETIVDDGTETGEVFDHLGQAYGLEGDRGEARRLGDHWVVTVNPGWPELHGKLDADLNSGSSATMSVWDGNPLADSTINVTVNDSSTLPYITTAYKVPSGRAIMAIHKSGLWYISGMAGCEVAQ